MFMIFIWDEILLFMDFIWNKLLLIFQQLTTLPYTRDNILEFILCCITVYYLPKFMWNILTNDNPNDIPFQIRIGKNKRKKQKRRNNGKIKEDITEYLTDDNKCLVCLNAIANVIYIPCKHILICKECQNKLKDKTNCILCRKNVEKVLY